MTALDPHGGRARVALDPRGPRFVAAVTTAVLAVVLVTGSGWLALAQTVVFAFGSVDPRWNPYALVYRWLVRPRLAPPTETEDVAPVRFAQRVGFGFLAVATAAYLGGLTAVGVTFVGLGLAAAFLNAAFGLCLGCEVYLLLARTRQRSRRTS